MFNFRNVKNIILLNILLNTFIYVINYYAKCTSMSNNKFDCIRIIFLIKCEKKMCLCFFYYLFGINIHWFIRSPVFIVTFASFWFMMLLEKYSGISWMVLLLHYRILSYVGKLDFVATTLEFSYDSVYLIKQHILYM